MRDSKVRTTCGIGHNTMVTLTMKGRGATFQTAIQRVKYLLVRRLESECYSESVPTIIHMWQAVSFLPRCLQQNSSVLKSAELC